MLAYRVSVRVCRHLFKHTVMNILISTLMLGNIRSIWASPLGALPLISYIRNCMCAGKLILRALLGGCGYVIYLALIS